MLIPLLLITTSWLAHGAPKIYKRGCDDHGAWHEDGERWLRGHHFLVVCKEGQIKVQECVTDVGSILPLGTKSFVENGIEYSCVDDDSIPEPGTSALTPSNAPAKKSDKVVKEIEESEGSGESGTIYDWCEEGVDDVISQGFMLCCISYRLKGCVDDNKDLVKKGHYMTKNRLLKACTIQPGGMKGRIESKGCFNGTESDDIDDEERHIAKWTVWREGDIDYRCGDEGIVPYRCYVMEKGKEKQYYVGSAWIDDNREFSVCK